MVLIGFYKDNIAGASSETTRRQSRRVVSTERRRGDRTVLFRPEEFRFMTISPSSIKEKCPHAFLKVHGLGEGFGYC